MPSREIPDKALLTAKDRQEIARADDNTAKQIERDAISREKNPLRELDLKANRRQNPRRLSLPRGARTIQHPVRQQIGLAIANHDQEPLRSRQRQNRRQDHHVRPYDRSRRWLDRAQLPCQVRELDRNTTADSAPNQFNKRSERAAWTG